MKADYFQILLIDVTFYFLKLVFNVLIKVEKD